MPPQIAAMATPKKMMTMPKMAFFEGLSPTINMLSRKPKGIAADVKGVREITFSIFKAYKYKSVPKSCADVTEAKLSPTFVLVKC